MNVTPKMHFFPSRKKTPLSSESEENAFRGLWDIQNYRGILEAY
jgi:hypothetical protein